MPNLLFVNPQDCSYFIKEDGIHTYNPVLELSIRTEWKVNYGNGKHRHRLDVAKENIKSGTTVCVVMKNPALADLEQSDYSISFMMEGLFGDTNSPLHEKFSLLKTGNIKKIIFINLYSKYQQTDYKGAEDTCQASEERNKAIAQEALSEADKIVFALNKKIYNDENFKDKYEEFLTLAHDTSKQIYRTNMHPSATGRENSDNYKYYDTFQITRMQ